jgi:hypothetical protein
VRRAASSVNNNNVNNPAAVGGVRREIVNQVPIFRIYFSTERFSDKCLP